MNILYNRKIGLLLFLLAFGYGIWSGMHESDHNKHGKMQTEPLVFCARDVHKGESVPMDALEVRLVPATQMSKEGVRSTALVVGRTAKCDISKGQVVTYKDFGLTDLTDK